MKSHGCPGKPGAKSYGVERRKESIRLEEGLVGAVFRANGRRGRGPYQSSPENSLRNHAPCFFSRHGPRGRDKTEDGAKGGRERFLEIRDSLLGTGYINDLRGLVSGAFAILNLDTRVP